MKNLGLLFSLLPILNLSSTAQELSGPLSDTLGPGSYTVVGDIFVQNGDSLIILPGTTLLFQGSSGFEFDIYGYFSAVGTESDSIRFMPDAPGSNWAGIDFYADSDPDCRLEYCLITGSSASGVDCFNCGPVISHCTICDNTANFGGGIYCTGGWPTITDCLITGNSTNVCGAGIWASSSNVTILNCSFIGNNAGNSAGGIYCYSSDALIADCIITGNTSTAGAGGIFCRYANQTISNCTISDNFTETVGGGICCNDASPIIDHCLITGNTANLSGGGMECYISSPTITNCTISANTAAMIGGGIESFDSTPTIVNTIIEGNFGGGIYFFNGINASITYGNFCNNEGGDFTGDPPQGLGGIITINTNGDSCDAYFNIFADPFFVDPSSGNYHLQANSPCIDAGDPASPPDPDNTAADMGAFYFDQGTTSPVSITLTPYNPPVQIPAGGGSFDFNIEIANTSTTTQTFDGWIMATLPGGAQVGPLLGPVTLALAGGVSIARDRTQAVPGGAPAGMYTYDAYVGIYPSTIWDEDHFDFEKLSTSDGGSFVSEWGNWGDSFEAMAGAVSARMPDEIGLLPAYPNPFNPETHLSLSLPEAGYVTLIIYDAQGRIVARLYDGWYPAGYHEVTFGAQGLPSGIYFARLTAGQVRQTQKLVLMK